MPFSAKRAGSVAYSLVMFAVVSVLAGVLIAGLIVPLAAMVGVGSRAAADELNNLPAELATPAPPTRSKVLMANGKVLAYFYDENRIPVSLNQIAPVMRQAQLAIEDHRFYQHGALDVKGTLRALVRNTAGDGSTQGGSSITQQYVKMVQIEACQAKADAQCVRDAQAPTLQRKVRELRYAIALEKRLTKDQILERYLNIAYYGDGAYGVEAAARHYYSTTAAKLNLPQSAMLAGLVQNPDGNNPVRNPSAALERRDVVLNRMAELNMITPQQAARAKKEAYSTKWVKPTRNGCVGTRYPFLCDYVRRTLLKTPSLGATVQDRENMIMRGGITIQTAIDPKSQDIAQRAVSKIIGPEDPLISTMDMVEPGTGLILAMAQNRPVMGTDRKKGESYYNYSAEYDLGGAEGYQAGSTFKVFTAAAALEKGIPLTKIYNARSPLNLSGVPFRTCLGTARDPNYNPRNSTVSGTMNMYRGMAMSVNTYFLQLERDTGVCEASKMADRLGVKESKPAPGVNLTNDPRIQVPSFTLGVANVSPLSMAEAYATFAARGVHCDPVVVAKIIGPNGKQLEPLSANCKQAISTDVADGVTTLLRGVMTNGTGRPVRLSGIRNQAGKTGTIEDNQAVWFNGFTPLVAGAAMIAIDPTSKHWRYHHSGVKGYTVPSSGFYLQGHGSTDAGARIWHPAMQAAMKGKPDVGFHNPPSSIVQGQMSTVPSLYGLGIAEATTKLQAAGFTVDRRYVYSSQQRYSFLGWYPGPGSSIPQFGTVTAVFSDGPDPAIQRAQHRAAQRQAEQQQAQQQAAQKAAAQKAAQQKAAQQKAAQQKAAEQKKNKGKKKKP
jgi:membrane peptidoglycan carboxypeptidase